VAELLQFEERPTGLRSAEFTLRDEGLEVNPSEIASQGIEAGLKLNSG